MRQGKGLNENLAREILELHTLGVDGGYGQDDVRAFARILTGWSVARGDEAAPGAFLFRPRVHEPGAKVLLGKRYDEAGLDEGERALDDLARHPATARHIATKLARHFIADDPPAAAVNHLTMVFADSHGDLKAVSIALVERAEPWSAAQSKVKSPNDLVLSSFRALAGHTGAADGFGALAMLGQPPFAASSPAGWPDTADAWVGPEAMVQRVDWSLALANRLGATVDPALIARSTVGPFIQPATVTAMQRAPGAADGLALLLASPEFQRR